MFKRKIWIVAAVAALVVGIFGFDTAVGYLKGVRNDIKQFTSDNTPTSMDVTRIEELIQKEASKIDDFQNEVSDLDDKIVGERQKVRRIEDEIGSQKYGLKMAKNLIQEDKKVYLIAGRNTTIYQVQADATARVKYVKTLETQLFLSNTLIDTLVITADSCKDNLSDARKSILAKQMELEQLKAREMNAEIKAKAAALSQSLLGMSDSVLNHSELQEAMKTYEQKIGRIERKAGQVPQGDAPWIDYSGPKELPDLVTRIDEALSS